ncbi:MAG TPA: hypothetical protein VKT71_04190 [Candidatus Acidoferrales bacterium]|nr:hypothetical protein [Candidatus Acidoferrales bacterium]
MATKKKKRKTKLKKVLKKKPTPKKKAPAKKAAPKSKKKPAPKKRGVRGRSQNTSPIAFDRAGFGAGAAGQSGSLQGLSNRAGADSESVDELLEEGNAFEAEVVEGVEDAPDADQGEVRTREIPEDDVPEEYQDPDK